MRQLIVQVPSDREAEVLECLQGQKCGLRNVTQHNDGIVATCTAFVSIQVSAAARNVMITGLRNSSRGSKLQGEGMQHALPDLKVLHPPGVWRGAS